MNPGHSPTQLESDPLELLDAVPLTEAESEYVEAARAANTLRGYRSDWNEFTSWCTQRNRAPLPAAASTITGYLSDLAKAGAKQAQLAEARAAKYSPRVLP